MHRQGHGQRLRVTGDDHIALLFCPDQDLRIRAAKLWCAGLAYAGDLYGQCALGIEAQELRPKWAAEIFVNQVAKRHGSDPSGTGRHHILAILTFWRSSSHSRIAARLGACRPWAASSSSSAWYSATYPSTAWRFSK